MINIFLLQTGKCNEESPLIPRDSYQNMAFAIIEKLFFHNCSRNISVWPVIDEMNESTAQTTEMQGTLQI